MEKEGAKFENLVETLKRNGSERQFLAQEQAAQGLTDPPRSQYIGSSQQYIKNEDAAYGLNSVASIEGTPE